LETDTAWLDRYRCGQLEIVGIMVTEWKTSIDVIEFAREIPKYYENKPVIKTGRGPWYRWTLQRLGLKHEYETFGERNAIEGWFNILKAILKRFWKRFPFNIYKDDDPDTTIMVKPIHDMPSNHQVSARDMLSTSQQFLHLVTNNRVYCLSQNIVTKIIFINKFSVKLLL